MDLLNGKMLTAATQSLLKYLVHSNVVQYPSGQRSVYE